MSPHASRLVALALAVAPVASAQVAPSPPWRRPPTRPAAPPAIDDVADFTVDAAGRVAILLDSAGAAQRVVLEQRRPEAPRVPGQAPPRSVLGAGTCTTPCVLHVPPGPLTLRAEGAGLRRTDTLWDAPSTDARVVLRAASSPRWNVGIGLVAVGATMLVALAGLGILSQTSGGPDLPAAPTIGVGLGGVALLAVGVPLLALNLTGVARVTASAPR